MKNKRCPKCGQNKGLNEFSSSGYCKECHKAYCKANYEKNKARHKQVCKKWREDNKECVKKYNEEQREKNKAEMKEYKAKWYKDNKEHHKQVCKQWREDNKGYYLYIIRNSEEVFYVGATEHLNYRLSNHVNCNSSNTKNLMESDKWTEIKYLDITNVVANREEMLLLENSLIDLYKPMYNKVMNRIKNVDKLREFSLVAEVHGLNQQWKLYCKNKKII